MYHDSVEIQIGGEISVPGLEFGWADIQLKHLFDAYRKAKADCFFERTVLAAEQFTAFETHLLENLSALQSALSSGKIDELLKKYLTPPVLVAKKLTTVLREKQSHGYFSDPNRFFVGLVKNHDLRAEFRLVGNFPVELHILSALWVNLVGEKFDGKLGSCAYGSRLRRYKRSTSDSTTSGAYHLNALGSFEPYFTPYKKWRAKGLSAIRGELDAGRPVIAISLDLANYYHCIDPTFIVSPGFQKTIGVSLSSFEQSFTYSLATALENWASLASQLFSSFGELPIPSNRGLPIGLSAARVIANVLLWKFDQQISQGVTPVYYGRYVDDMFLVIHDPGHLSSSEELFTWMGERVPSLAKMPDEKAILIDLGNEYAAASRIALQHQKQKVFFLEGSVGLDLLANIETEIREVSSERRLLPDPETLEQMASAKVLTAAETAADEVDTLRRANVLSVRRLGWSILLRSVETLARDFHASDWLTERMRFYEFARAHILRPDRILDHADYLPRLLSLAIALRDWEEATKLWKTCKSSVQQLQDAVSSYSQNKILINGSELGSKSTAVWEGFLNHLRKICADAALRSIRWKKTESPAPASPAELQLLNELGLGTSIESIRKRALLLRESDWAKISYKDHLRRRGVKPRAPQKGEDNLLLLHSQPTHLTDFLIEANEQSRHETWAARTSFHYPPKKKPAQFESLIPYLFPTRPYTAPEISLYAPSSVRTGRWPLYIRALRGAWIKENGATHAEDHLNWIGKNANPQRITLGITSLLTDEGSWRQTAKDDPDLSPHRYQRLGALVRQAVQTKPAPTHLILPELALPERWLRSVSSRLRDAGISLIAGLEYFHHSNHKNIHSEAALILCDDSLGYPSWVDLRQRKSQPAPDEERRLLRDFGKTWDCDELRKPIYIHRGFHFGVLICSELQNIKHRQAFQGNVDCMMVLSWNQDLETFSALVDSAALDVHAYIAMVNNSRYGDSRVRAPAKESFERDICRLRGGKNDYLVVVDLNVESLREFQSRSKRWPDRDDPYKPVPEGFVLPERRRATPK